jgi:hypothetical protein
VPPSLRMDQAPDDLDRPGCFEHRVNGDPVVGQGRVTDERVRRRRRPVRPRERRGGNHLTHTLAGAPGTRIDFERAPLIGHVTSLVVDGVALEVVIVGEGELLAWGTRHGLAALSRRRRQRVDKAGLEQDREDPSGRRDIRSVDE